MSKEAPIPSAFSPVNNNINTFELPRLGESFVNRQLAELKELGGAQYPSSLGAAAICPPTPTFAPVPMYYIPVPILVPGFLPYPTAAAYPNSTPSQNPIINTSTSPQNSLEIERSTPRHPISKAGFAPTKIEKKINPVRATVHTVQITFAEPIIAPSTSTKASKRKEITFVEKPLNKLKKIFPQITAKQSQIVTNVFNYDFINIFLEAHPTEDDIKTCYLFIQVLSEDESIKRYKLEHFTKLLSHATLGSLLKGGQPLTLTRAYSIDLFTRLNAFLCILAHLPEIAIDLYHSDKNLKNFLNGKTTEDEHHINKYPHKEFVLEKIKTCTSFYAVWEKNASDDLKQVPAPRRPIIPHSPVTS